MQNYSKFLMKNESLEKRKEKYVIRSQIWVSFIGKSCVDIFLALNIVQQQNLAAVLHNHKGSTLYVCVCVRGREGSRKGSRKGRILTTSKNILI